MPNRKKIPTTYPVTSYNVCKNIYLQFKWLWICIKYFSLVPNPIQILTPKLHLLTLKVNLVRMFCLCNNRSAHAHTNSHMAGAKRGPAVNILGGCSVTWAACGQEAVDVL